MAYKAMTYLKPVPSRYPNGVIHREMTHGFFVYRYEFRGGLLPDLVSVHYVPYSEITIQ